MTGWPRRSAELASTARHLNTCTRSSAAPQQPRQGSHYRGFALTPKRRRGEQSAGISGLLPVPAANEETGNTCGMVCKGFHKLYCLGYLR